ncbi:MAG: hypothetical protein KC444_10000, partial [Nitrosopumilus sp.]|nr:hypothetical protein [Nitrosopumilus sp.]
MNTADTLFVISTILVPLMLISLNYSAIIDFYTHDVPLNKSVIIANFPSDEPENFQNIRKEKDSTCYTSPSMNQYCYIKPKMFDEQQRDHLYSSIIGDNGINGEIHFDRVGLEGGIFTIKKMVLLDEDSALFTFADKDYRTGNKDRTAYEITEDFEFTTVVEKYDTFITHCGNFNGTGATLVQYLGVAAIDESDYF